MARFSIEKRRLMRAYLTLCGAGLVVLSLSANAFAQAGAPPAPGGRQGGGRGGVQAAGGPDAARVIPGGGIFAPGWTGKIDAAEAANGQVINNSKLSMEGNVLHIETGPATTYWNPANKASGTYTV